MKIDFACSVIELTKAEMKEAQKYGSEMYKELMNNHAPIVRAAHRRSYPVICMSVKGQALLCVGVAVRNIFK